MPSRIKSPTRFKISLGGITGAFLILLAQPALACGGFFCSQVPIDQAGERILFVADGDEKVSHVQIQYTGSAEKFSWVIPMPTPPKLSVGSDARLTALRNATRPQFRLNMKPDQGQCKLEDFLFGPPSPTSAKATSAPGGVTIVSEQQVGPFDSVVLTSDDPTALKQWLRDNGYDIPKTLDPLLDPYVAMKAYFLAMKLQKGRSTGDLQPIVMRYKAEKFAIPIRLTAVAATPDMDVYVWLLGQHRAIPENYKHAEINETRIDWLRSGSNYRAVVTEAIDESGGLGFVTDYAGDSSVVPTETFDPSRFDLEKLRLATEPIAFAQAIRAGQYFPAAQPSGRGPFQPVSAQETAFLSRYIPKPPALKDLDDSNFYPVLENYAAELKAAEIVVDTAKAIAELNETVVTPFKDIKTLFARHPYLTQLYSTISPEEMTVDPVFSYNPDLPKVSNIREAEGVRLCSRDKSIFEAPVKITLSNGTSFQALSTTNQGTPVAMPAARRIEQLKESGQPEVIMDNGPKIAQTVNANTQLSQDASGTIIARQPGFGCACNNPSTPAPFRQGAAEGMTYGGFVLGWLGWRRLRRKK